MAANAGRLSSVRAGLKSQSESERNSLWTKKFSIIKIWKMEKAISSYLAFNRISFGVVSRCCCIQTRRSYKQFVNVINQNANAARRCTQIRYLVTGKYLTNFSANQYKVGELHKIDTSACSKKFQLAWLNYVRHFGKWKRNKLQVWHRLGTHWCGDWNNNIFNFFRKQLEQQELK